MVLCSMDEVGQNFKPESYGFVRIDPSRFYREFSRYQEEMETRVIKEFARIQRVSMLVRSELVNPQYAMLGIKEDKLRAIADGLWECSVWQRIDKNHGIYPLTHCRRPLFCQRCMTVKATHQSWRYQTQLSSLAYRKSNRKVNVFQRVFHPCRAGAVQGMASVERGFKLIRKFRRILSKVLWREAPKGKINSRYKIGPVLWSIHCKTPEHLVWRDVHVPIPHLHLLVSAGGNLRQGYLDRLLAECVDQLDDPSLDGADDGVVQRGDKILACDFSEGSVADEGRLDQGIQSMVSYAARLTNLGQRPKDVVAAGLAAMAFTNGRTTGIMNAQLALPRIELPDEFQISSARFVCRAAVKMEDVAWWAYQDEVVKWNL